MAAKSTRLYGPDWHAAKELADQKKLEAGGVKTGEKMGDTFNASDLRGDGYVLAPEDAVFHAD
jgi:hypothetical protein